MTDDTNIDCEWSSVTATTIQNLPTSAPLDPKVDLRLEWKPTNIFFGPVPWNQFMFVGLESWYSSTTVVPWSYGRDEIPNLLLAHHPGITIDMWQTWVDQATQIWIERNEICRQLIQFGNYYTVTYFIVLTIWILAVYLPENIVFLEWTALIISILLCIIDLYWTRFRDSALRICEEKWSNLIQDIQSSIGKEQGLRVEHCYNSTKPIVICCQPINPKYTVGLTFIIQQTAGGNVDEVNPYRMEQITQQQVNVSPSEGHVSPQKSHPTNSYQNDAQWNSSLGNTNNINNWKLKLIPINTKVIPNQVMSTQNMIIVVTWSHNCEEVPTWLSSRGITLAMWKEWWDHANILSMERVQQNYNVSKLKRYGYIQIAVIFLVWIAWSIFIPSQSEYFSIGFWFLMIFAYIYGVVASGYCSFIEQSNFLQNETKWSDLVQKINATIRKELRLCVSQCYHANNGHNDLLHYTVGIEFSPLRHLTHPLVEIV